MSSQSWTSYDQYLDSSRWGGYVLILVQYSYSRHVLEVLSYDRRQVSYESKHMLFGLSYWSIISTAHCYLCLRTQCGLNCRC